MALRITQLSTTPVFAHEIEIVERKGLGHPDTLCDALAESKRDRHAHRRRAHGQTTIRRGNRAREGISGSFS